MHISMSHKILTISRTSLSPSECYLMLFAINQCNLPKGKQCSAVFSHHRSMLPIIECYINGFICYITFVKYISSLENNAPEIYT
jgi:hypothetical protein